ncbi:Six-hairpin glycosidase-like protein [Durotheca rogersii]|uniref:Six-hairpin glycosidase-like protein n=1 Tax=Durotheca rogersii TaxID=419775 RepID=UPI00221EFB8E|nr:Six-hairpin glycosidase-like protein [Durotheca rogersii]KAI5859357.1 Six-hairpin glycosidase-like protein [Durotheca rogersii]
MTPSSFLLLSVLPALALAAIDRHAVVSRFNVVRSKLPEEITNQTTPLQVGNGDFAFNVDNTGMQTFIPFNTLSSWGWHNDSMPTNGEKLSDYHGVEVLTHGRNISYDLEDPNLPEISKWLTANPNRINLGRIGLRYKGDTLPKSLITEPRQELDVWNGTITSTFKVDGRDVKVVTQGDFATDAVAFQIDSDLISTGDLEVELDFPYPPKHSVTASSDFEIFMGSYDFPLNHTTSIVKPPAGPRDGVAHIRHELQETAYFVNLRWPGRQPLSLTRDEPAGSSARTAHRYTLSAARQPLPRGSRGPAASIAFTAHFSPDLALAASPAAIRRRNLEAWNAYWREGGFVDVTASTNPNATELQRRIVLTQYYMRVNSAATGQIPQESGLVYNGWWGKFHLEMVVWHCAHWATWGRQRYFDRIFPSMYEALLPSSVARARRMGWDGARWPKMTELGTAGIAPGETRAYLMWQQPHPMYLAELAYRAKPTARTLRDWDGVVTASADYMASFAQRNATTGRYDLGPPSKGVTENSFPLETRNLAYEIAYWRWGLDAAARWKTRLGQHVPDAWTAVAENLAPPPQADGMYVPWEGLNASWWADPALTKDPRSVIMLQGILPDTPAVSSGGSRERGNGM